MFASRTDWPLATNRLSRAVAERRKAGLSLLDLTESNPTRCGFAYDPHEILGALADPRSLTYQPDPRGPLPAREAVAGYYAERGVKVDPRQIFLTTSTNEAYTYVFRLLADPADRVLVPRPGYPLLDFLGQVNDLELTPYTLVYDGAWRIDLEGLRAGLEAATRSALSRPRAVLLIHPNNPTGSFVRQEELESLVACCRQHSLGLIADEVFADYAFQPSAGRVTTHAGEREVLTFTLSGLSKISALPQMKLAWIVVNGPSDLLGSALERLEIIADTYLSVSAPLAHALPRLLETRHSIQPQILERVRRNLQWLDNELVSQAVSRLQSEGGWYAILKLPSGARASRGPSDEDWAVEFVERDGVLLHPGHFYDFPSEGYLVISLLQAAEAFEEGVHKVLARLAGTQ